MWEAITANQRRSWWLIGILGLALLVLGAAIGATVQSYTGSHAHGWQALIDSSSGLGPERPMTLWEELASYGGGALVGMGVAALVWLVLWLTAVGGGDGILLNAAKAREIQKEDAPQLWNVVEEMTIAAGLPKMPRVFLIDDASLNAFAVGYRPESAAVAVTAGLLKRLNRDELQGVIAHEIGHISNQDVRFMTLASVMVGAIVMIAQGFLRGTYYSGRSRRSSSRGGGQGAAILLIVALVLAVLAPVAAQLLYFACSRRREYLADACSARFTRYPEGLASALEKISHQGGGQKDVNKALAPLYIINPLEGASLLNVMSTHPSTAERIRILRGMAGAGYAAYEAAFRAARGQSANCIGARTLQQSEAVAVRAPSPTPASRDEAVSRARAVGDLLDRVLPFVVIPCSCGLKMKLPPGFNEAEVSCPRCGRHHEVPHATTDAPAPAVGPARAAPPLRYHRRGGGWESFRCACTHTVQLSPSFTATQITCPKCQRVILIDG